MNRRSIALFRTPDRQAYLRSPSYRFLQEKLREHRPDAITLAAELFFEWMDVRMSDLEDDGLMHALSYRMQDVLGVSLRIYPNLDCGFILWQRYGQ